MRPRHTLDRSYRELAAYIGPWTHSKLYRVGLAVQAAGGAASDDAAQELMWQGAKALESLGRQPTVRDVLELQGVDLPAITVWLQQLEVDHRHAQADEEREKVRSAPSGWPMAFPNYVGGG